MDFVSTFLVQSLYQQIFFWFSRTMINHMLFDMELCFNKKVSKGKKLQRSANMYSSESSFLIEKLHRSTDAPKNKSIKEKKEKEKNALFTFLSLSLSAQLCIETKRTANVHGKIEQIYKNKRSTPSRLFSRCVHTLVFICCNCLAFIWAWIMNRGWSKNNVNIAKRIK